MALETVLEPVVATRRVRPFSYLDRKENAALDQADAERALARKEAGEPTEYFYRALYKPEMGAFVALPDDDEDHERAKTGNCPVCEEERREAERLATVVLPDGKVSGVETLSSWSGRIVSVPVSVPSGLSLS